MATVATGPASVLTEGALREMVVPQVLAAVPSEWRGTTFDNSNLLGRELFSERLQALLASKAAGGAALTSAELSALGNAEDYLRVASNMSTVYENVQALRRGMDAAHVFSFASRTMPVLAVALARGQGPVHVYHGDGPAPFSPAECSTLARLGADVTCRAGGAPPPPPPGAEPRAETVLALEACLEACGGPAAVDGCVGGGGGGGSIDGGLLFITNPARVRPAAVLTMRKRLACPITTPAAEAALQAFSGQPPAADAEAASSEELAAYHAHLQSMNGTEVHPAAEPVTCQAGLPTIASLWLALKAAGGAEVVICSTCYGGSSELTDLVGDGGGPLRKTTFDLQGGLSFNDSIRETLEALAAAPRAGALPATVVFVEIPSNPDQKLPDLAALARDVGAYQAATGARTLVLVDTTFAPASGVLGKLAAHAPGLEAMTFVSMSKSVSRGLTTAGALVANHTAGSRELLGQARDVAALLDVTGRRDQMLRLCRNHAGVEARCQRAYEVMVDCGGALVRGVAAHHTEGAAMALTYVAPEHAAEGFTSSTFSFNLPAPAGASAEAKASLAQRFVDLLTEDRGLFKPCVSFGQDNGLVYCTVPATSTQGAIKEEDKAKQAVGGVQLARLSFPPTIDVEAVKARIEYACKAIYS